MPDHESDAHVIRVSLRDADSFAAIFDRHYDAVFRYLARRLGPDDAEDAASDVFVEAFRNRGKFDLSTTSARPWLYGIAANIVRGAFRRRRRTLRLRERFAAEPGVWFETDVAASVEEREQIRAVAAALADMRTVDREVLLLAAFTDLSYDDLATALDLPVGTVRSKLSRARAHLRAKLGPFDVSEGGALTKSGDRNA